MRDFLGVLLEVDDDVVLLKTPIVGEHTFKIGKVKKISSKKFWWKSKVVLIVGVMRNVFMRFGDTQSN